MKKSIIAIGLIALILIGGSLAIGFAVWETPQDPIKIPEGGKIGVQFDTKSGIFGSNADKLVPLGAAAQKDAEGNDIYSAGGNAIAKMGKLRIKCLQENAANGIKFTVDNVTFDGKPVNTDYLTVYFLFGYSQDFDYLHFAATGEIRPVNGGKEKDLPRFLMSEYNGTLGKYTGGSANDTLYTSLMKAGEIYEFTMVVRFTDNAAEFAGDVNSDEIIGVNGDIGFKLNIETNL